MHYVTTSRLNPRRRRDGRTNGSHAAGTGDRATPDNHSIHDGVGGGGGGGNGTGTASPGSSETGESQLRLRLPQLEDMVAWALCLMMEVASVQLTAIALRMKREEAIRAATQAVKDVDGSRHASASAGGAGGSAGAGGGDNIRTGTSTTQHDDNESGLPPSGNLIAVTSLPQHAFDRELSRRRMALFYYLVRSPVFDRYYLAPTYLL